MRIHLLTLAAASPQERSFRCPRTSAQPTHSRLSTSVLGTVLGGGRDLGAEQMRSRRNEFPSRPSWSKEEDKGSRGGFVQQGRASSICLWGEAVYSSLLLCGCTWCHILPLKGCKLTFSSRNIPFRKKQGKLCHHSNMCEPPVLSLSWYTASCMNNSSLMMISLDTFHDHYTVSLLEIEIIFFCASRQSEVRK